jgi:hypothetical protein
MKEKNKDYNLLDEEWNVLTSPWLEVMSIDAKVRVYSPFDALKRASDIRCIALASPLDLFAAHRFLLTLIYWKAGEAGGVEIVRESLLKGDVPEALVEAIEEEADRFGLFHDTAPFLQDRKVHEDKAKSKKGKTTKAKPKSAGSLFADFASGTNVAHFHHGDDENMQLCMRCATIGMLRLVPWSQSGGAGITPSVHNAPPIMALACGDNLATTLGLNLVPLEGKPGEPMWTGHFKPSNPEAAIPYLEAFTWNPRRVLLPSPEIISVCWSCGRKNTEGIGPIIFEKNEETKARRVGKDKSIPFIWRDPSAFYHDDYPYRSLKSTREESALKGKDFDRLLDPDKAPKALVVDQNPGHQHWRLIIPCTNKNKTFDHREVVLRNWSPEEIRAKIPPDAPAPLTKVGNGWIQPHRAPPDGSSSRFVRAAVQLLTESDWAVLSSAAYREMQDAPAAFDVLSGLLWGLRDKVGGLPAKNVAWLVLKLMASVPPRARQARADAFFCPLDRLPKRQTLRSAYPASFPRSHRLEAELRRLLDINVRSREPSPVAWTDLCHGLDQLID